MSSAVARVASILRHTKAASSLAKQRYSQSAVSLGGASPPLPPFARIPPVSEKLVEQHDAIWDDGVAPEVTLDFDCQHISSGEGLAWWLGGLGFFAGLYQVVKATNPEGKNPAVNRMMNLVGENPIEIGGYKKFQS